MPFGDWVNSNSQGLLQAGIGLLSGKTGSEQASMGLQGFSNGLQQNRTMQYLQANNPELAQAVGTGALTPGDALKLDYASRTKTAQDAQDEKNWRDRQQFVWANDPDRDLNHQYKVAQINALNQKANGTGTGQGEMGLDLVYGKDANGKTVAFQSSKRGGLVPVQTPEGTQLSDPYTKAFDSASGKAGGQSQGAAAAALPSAKMNVDQVDLQIQDLKNDPDLNGNLGTWGANTPNVFPASRRVQSKIDKLGGTAFLQARAMLKGGGAITDFESKKAEGAMIRLDQAQSPADFRAALDEFNDAVKTGYAKLQAEAAAPNNRGPSPAGAAPTVDDLVKLYGGQ